MIVKQTQENQNLIHDDHNEPTPKVFCIGFHKTGTSSLGAALRELGFKTQSYFGVSDSNIAQVVRPRARSLLETADAFEDMPWPVLFRDLDKWAPGSRFILTVRDPSSWYKSVVSYFGDTKTPMREWVYGAGNGSPVGRENVYKDRLLKHNNDVRSYFSDRPGDLLELPIGSDLNWEPICSFLDRPVPAVPFPRINTRSSYARGLMWLHRRLLRQQDRTQF